MEFKQFNTLLRNHVESMTSGKEHLFVVDLEKEVVWNTYLDSFPEGTNEIFRERREYDCSCCRHFVRDLGRVVSIKGQKITTIWDFDAQSEKFQPVVDALSALVKAAPVVNVFTPTDFGFGVNSTPEYMDDGTVTNWYHFSARISGSVRTYSKDEVGTKTGLLRDVRNVFKRSLEEIDSEALDTVLELIAQKSLYKGEEWNGPLTKFKQLQKKYSKLKSELAKDLFCWEISVQVGAALAKIKNHSIGVLLSDISEGMGLDDAVKRYEAIVAPTNYRRPKAIITKAMIAKAQKTVQELGFEESLGRRFAKMDDITVPNTLFANRSAKKAMSKGVFEELASSVPSKPKNLSKVEEIGIDEFVSDVLPKVSEMDVYLENGHAGNMMSLIAPTNEDSKSMLKWENNFSWTYSGNITDSMKERVKAAGGKVDGELRFSIQWNQDDLSLDDLDAHCIEPGGNRIFFSRKKNPSTTGNLDVDIVNPTGVAVENITWSNRKRMERGVYEFKVHCYSSRRAKSGFTAEIEFDGEVHSFEYASPLRQGEYINVAEVTFDGTGFKLKERLRSTTSSREIWGLASNDFHPVSIMTLSPNYWDGQKGIGHRHFFFMLESCKNPETPSGFFVEFLDDRLRDHRKVFEALSGKMRVEDSDDQLSGLGFSATKRSHVVVRVKGSFERMLKVKF